MAWLSSTDEDTNASQWTEGDDAEGFMDESGLDSTSPIGYDAEEQAAVHDELKDFLGSDDESESDNESLPDETAGTGTKRKRGDGTESGTDEEESGDDDGDEEKRGSRLSQRIKRSYERNTGLREVVSAPTGGEDTLVPSGPQEDESDSETLEGRDQNANPDDDDDELEREMLAALEEGAYDPQAEEDIAAENG
jgi:RNA polymerase II subunit A-like phosphatase